MSTIENINSRIPTYSNKKKAELKNWHKLLFLSPIIFIVLIFKANDWYSLYRLSHYGEKTWAKITKVALDGVRDEYDIYNVQLVYKVEGSICVAYTTASVNNRYVINPLDIPLFPEQEYEITYDKENCERYSVDLSKPNVATIILYLKDVSMIIAKLENTSNIESMCIAREIFRNFGFDGLAYLYFYDEYVIENLKHNKQNFPKFWNSKKVKEIIAKCKSKSNY